MSDDRLLTTDEVANYLAELGLSLKPQTLASWRMQRKNIPFIRIGQGTRVKVRYKKSAVDDWLAAQEVAVTG